MIRFHSRASLKAKFTFGLCSLLPFLFSCARRLPPYTDQEALEVRQRVLGASPEWVAFERAWDAFNRFEVTARKAVDSEWPAQIRKKSGLLKRCKDRARDLSGINDQSIISDQEIMAILFFLEKVFIVEQIDFGVEEVLESELDDEEKEREIWERFRLRSLAWNQSTAYAFLWEVEEVLEALSRQPNVLDWVDEKFVDLALRQYRCLAATDAKTYAFWTDGVSMADISELKTRVHDALRRLALSHSGGRRE